MPARTKYNPLFHDDWAWSLAAMGATCEEIADAMGVDRHTLVRWTKKYPSFGDSLARGKGVSDARVIKSLYQRAVGYSYEEEETVNTYDKNGELKSIKVRHLSRHAPPDVGAQCFWLKNRQKLNWQDKPVIIQEDVEDEQTQFYLPVKEELEMPAVPEEPEPEEEQESGGGTEEEQESGGEAEPPGKEEQEDG